MSLKILSKHSSHARCRILSFITTLHTHTTKSMLSSSPEDGNSVGSTDPQRSQHHRKGIYILPMPQCSPTMTTGKITKWHAAVGSGVVAYDLVLDVSAHGLHDTDAGNSAAPVSMEIESLEDGTLCALLYAEGAVVPVNTPIAVLCDEPANMKYAESLNVLTHAGELAAAPRAMWQAYKKSHLPEEAGKCI